MSRLGVLAGFAIAVLSLSLVSCGDSDGEAAGPTSSETLVTTSSSATTRSTTSASTETSPTTGETSPSTETSATSAAPGPNVDDLETALAAEIEATYQVGSGVVDCRASGELVDWQPVLCTFVPDVPSEFGGVYVSMLDGGRYAWAVGVCCDAGPLFEDYQPGLFCRDLAAPPPGTEPGRWRPEEDHLSYGLAMFYWLTENRPDRMDADLNGRPCETVYPTEEVTAFWDSVSTL